MTINVNLIAASRVDPGTSSVCADCLLVGRTEEHALLFPDDCSGHYAHHERVHSLW
jgi:hypothetical protein